MVSSELAAEIMTHEQNVSTEDTSNGHNESTV